MSKYRIKTFSNKRDQHEREYRYVPCTELHTMAIVRAYLGIADLTFEIEDVTVKNPSYILVVPDTPETISLGAVLSLVKNWPLQLQLGKEQSHVLVELTQIPD